MAKNEKKPVCINLVKSPIDTIDLRRGDVGRSRMVERAPCLMSGENKFKPMMAVYIDTRRTEIPVALCTMDFKFRCVLNLAMAGEKEVLAGDDIPRVITDALGNLFGEAIITNFVLTSIKETSDEEYKKILDYFVDNHVPIPTTYVGGEEPKKD